MFSINPVDWYESAKNAGMERELAELLFGTALSMLLSFLAGLNRVPLVGSAFVSMAAAGKLNIQNYKDGEALKKFSITYPKTLDDPDLCSGFITVSKEVIKNPKGD
jgi:hypothetical protein